MNTASLGVVAGLSVVMLAIFLATGQQLNLTITAVLVTGGIATLAVFFYGREEARDEFEETDDADEPPDDAAAMRSDEPVTAVPADEAQTTESD